MPTNKKATVSNKTVKRRKKKVDYDALTPETKASIIMDYVDNGIVDLHELADKYNVSRDNVAVIIKRHWTTLTNIRESQLLIESSKFQHDAHKNSTYHNLKNISRVPEMNERFMDLLSEPEDITLSKAEAVFCTNYVLTGNSLKALKTAGLDVSLIQEKGRDSRYKFDLACRLRIQYLKLKPNVAQYITKLREDKYIPDIIDKQFVQRELLEQLEHLKEDDSMAASSHHMALSRCIQDIGRTVGAFSDVVKIEEINPADALDYLEQLDSANPEPVSVLELTE